MWHLGTRISGVRSMHGLDHLRDLFLNNDGIFLTGILGSKAPAMLPCDIATGQPHKLCGAGSARPYIQLTTEIRRLVLPYKNALKINNMKIVRCLDIAE